MNQAPTQQPESPLAENRGAAPVASFRGLPRCTWRQASLWLLRIRRRYRVQGRSMLPTLQPGQSVLLNPHAYRRHAPQVDDVVLARHPVHSNLITIKRVGADPGPHGSDSVFLLGDNPTESTDSRSLGPLPLTHILGRIECSFP